MKTIPLTKGKVAQVSDHRYDELMKWKWQATIDTRGKKNWYASRTTRKKEVGYTRRIYMHRQILGLGFEDKREGDHIKTEETLNNTDENLRITDRTGQNRNRGARKDNTSGYRGVSKHPKYPGAWKAQVWANGTNKVVWWGYDPAEGYEVYKREIKKLHGEFARFD